MTTWHHYRRSYGTITAHCGGPIGPGEVLYRIKPTNVLHKPISRSYRSWLYDNIMAGVEVNQELYIICNYAYVGCNVHLVGHNAATIAKAATWLLNEPAPHRMTVV